MNPTVNYIPLVAGEPIPRPRPETKDDLPPTVPSVSASLAA